jgi:16S rRNA (adenine1518-N6/adenine1519-N6)-dimethyltransferase
MELPHAKKSLGQHWLTDLSTLEDICDLADLMPTDTVLEVGPGAGTLTTHLLKKAKRVVAVEFDEALARDLPKNLLADNLDVVQQDILQFDLTSMPKGYKVVANIPYYLTSKLLRDLSESVNPPAMIILLVQKEVAERVAAKPGDMSLLSISVQLYYQAELGPVVPAALFTPAPKVDSQVLKLVRRPEPLFTDLDEKAFFRVVKAGYANRRKTLLNSMAGGLRLDKPVVEEALNTANLPPNIRPQELSLVQWYNLYMVLTHLLP